MTYLYIALGGAAGALARFTLGGWVTALAGAAFPWATLAINVAGSLLLGLVLARFPDPGASAHLRTLLAVGFCGSFTTFSTFGYETVSLLQHDVHRFAAAYVGTSVLLGMAGVVAGLWLGGRVL